MSRRNQVRATLIEGKVIGSRDPLKDQMAEEVEYAIYPPRHEHKIPTYGAILTREKPSNSAVALDTAKVPLEIARQMADGVTAFTLVYRKKHEKIVMQTSPCHEELDLIDLRKAWNGVLVHRNAAGVVRVFKEDAIYLYESGQWSRRPYSDSIIQEVRNAVPQAQWDVLAEILQFAFHVLSPSRVGATLVWWIDETARFPHSKTDLSAIGVSVVDKTHLPALRSILRLHDGAAFVSHDGKVLSLGHQLQYSRRATRFIPEAGGTRHTSAKRFSFDEPRIVAIVISEEGPVSVFSDGAKVTELLQVSAEEEAAHLQRLVPGKADDVIAERRMEKCPNCGKEITVEIIVIYGLKERETGECPICGATVHSQMCWQINTRLVKVLPSETNIDRFLRRL